MKKYILLLMILFPILFCERASAQDVIKKKSGEIIQAKVLKVDSNKIEYYDLSEVDGPVRTLPIFAISSISYENGSLDVNPSGLYVDGDDLHDSKTGSQFSDDELKRYYLLRIISRLRRQVLILITLEGVRHLVHTCLFLED